MWASSRVASICMAASATSASASAKQFGYEGCVPWWIWPEKGVSWNRCLLTPQIWKYFRFSQETRYCHVHAFPGLLGREIAEKDLETWELVLSKLFGCKISSFRFLSILLATKCCITFFILEIGILGILGCWVLIFSSHFVPLGCSTVLLPARVVQALNLNFEDMGSHSQPHFNGGVAPDYGKTPHQYNHMVEAC